ncbi:unnamed protein product, partial [Effrenium voratum]
DLVKNEFVQKLQRVSIYCRWLAIGLLHQEYEYFLSKPDGLAHIVDVARCWDVSFEDFCSCVLAGIDSITVVYFRLCEEERECPPHLLPLLDLQAAASDKDVASDMSDHVQADDHASDSEDQRPQDAANFGGNWLDDLANVTVDTDLLTMLEAEVVDVDSASNGDLPRMGSQYRCPACPWRTFTRPARVKAHVRRYHKKHKQFVASGTKQIRILMCLHDSDQLLGRMRQRYLQRSASLLRSQVKPALSPTVNAIDRQIRMVLHKSGPRLERADAIRGKHVRRAGNILYTQDFAEELYREMLLNHAKARYKQIRFILLW